MTRAVALSLEEGDDHARANVVAVVGRHQYLGNQ
jgi:hypothetical protein